MPCSVFIATSLDGFIARPDGGIDWLPTPVPGGEDYGYHAFMDTVDAIVMGRNTYELVLKMGGWQYPKPVVVLSSRDFEPSTAIAETIVRSGGAPADVVQFCAARGWNSLYVDGGVTVQRFLAAGLVERLIVTRVPVLIGKGLPLFGTVPQDIGLEHQRTEAYADGLVQSEYRVRLS